MEAVDLPQKENPMKNQIGIISISLLAFAGLSAINYNIPEQNPSYTPPSHNYNIPEQNRNIPYNEQHPEYTPNPYSSDSYYPNSYYTQNPYSPNTYYSNPYYSQNPYYTPTPDQKNMGTYDIPNNSTEYNPSVTNQYPENTYSESPKPGTYGDKYYIYPPGSYMSPYPRSVGGINYVDPSDTYYNPNPSSSSYGGTYDTSAKGTYYNNPPPIGSYGDPSGSYKASSSGTFNQYNSQYGSQGTNRSY